MPTLDRTTSEMLGTTKEDIDDLITELRSELVVGNTISVSRINKLIKLWNDYNSHYHSVDDLRGIDTYGNVGAYGGAGTYDGNPENVYTLANSGGPSVSSVDNTQSITADIHNEIRNRIKVTAPKHVHTFDDRES